MKYLRIRTYLPRGIYARAVVILIFPVIMIQIVVTVVFIQRHHDRVTRQMVANVEPHLRLVLSRVDAAPDVNAAMERINPITIPLHYDVTILPQPENRHKDRRLFYDLSGKIVIDTIRKSNERVTSIDLLGGSGKDVEIRAQTSLGEAVIVIQRSVFSPSNPHQLLVLMVFTGIFLTLIAFLFLRNQLRPIQRLAKASEAFGQGEHVDLGISGATEVRSATRAFLEMRQHIEEQLKQRTQMLLSLGHDLKTPLTRLRIGLELLDKRSDTTALVSDIDTISNIIQRFLDFARGTKHEQLTLVDPVSMAVDIVSSAQRAGQNIILPRETNSLSNRKFSLRKTAVRRAVENLVSNAKQYSSKSRLTVETSGSHLTFRVDDDGPGIPPEHREFAMQPFTRLDESRNLDESWGVGLGLAIVRNIAREHGGDLHLSASPDLGGLRAEMTVPVRRSRLIPTLG